MRRWAWAYRLALWAHALAALCPRGARYTELSEATLDHSRRADIDPEQQLTTLMDTLLYRVVDSGFT